MKIYNEEITNLILGIGMDIDWHGEDHTSFPTKEQYYNMITGKTAVLPRMIIRMLQAVAHEDIFNKNNLGNEEFFIKYIENAGKAFQIKDDLINIVSHKFAKGKGSIGEDITEGKMTLMTIDCLNNQNYERTRRNRLSSI